MVGCCGQDSIGRFFGHFDFWSLDSGVLQRADWDVRKTSMIYGVIAGVYNHHDEKDKHTDGEQTIKKRKSGKHYTSGSGLGASCVTSLQLWHVDSNVS